ncbi:MAG: 3-isopropylmalate dehydratase [Chloroflexi bacterium]|nr:3-isopropylmalate dehydratase [Chloroflexota bacterium]
MTAHRVWAYGDNVNTDVIFPGKYTYTLRTPQEIAAHALEDLDPAFAAGARPGDVIVAGRNWGCGSSREQAVTALKLSGVVAIVAESFGGLYFRNCINQGVYPIVIAGVRDLIRSGDTLEIDRVAGTLRADGSTFDLPALPDSVRAILDAGGLLPMLQTRFKAAAVPNR